MDGSRSIPISEIRRSGSLLLQNRSRMTVCTLVGFVGFNRLDDMEWVSDGQFDIVRTVDTEVSGYSLETCPNLNFSFG